jgi:DNA end-binding protein Ku
VILATRATWKGLLKIALVQIPIKVFPATGESERLKFNQLHEPCSTRIHDKRWCEKCQREVPTAEIVKGFEFEKDKYVLLLPAELDAIQPPSTRVIDLVQVAAAAALEPRSIDRAYYLEPDGPNGSAAARAYAVMTAAFLGKVGIGKLAIYGREYLVAIGTHGPMLMLYTLHPASELRSITLDIWASVSTGELKLALQVLDSLTRPLDLAAFTDAYQADVRTLIDAKIAGEEIVVPPIVDVGPTLSLVDALTQSLQPAEKLRMAKADLRAPAPPDKVTTIATERAQRRREQA